ncbi:Ig-like domain-containing protein [uncultured Eubacterium sp.]|uniref:Ig-like domain-containing protein n=1 Tax=uncultured Eubacterium sp. TaxID=165185 RepID=UPI002673402F|nr:Ig-like domain-containing protein [uncultured Eubacterium sp.]
MGMKKIEYGRLWKGKNMKKKFLCLLTTVVAAIGMATMVNAATIESNGKVNKVDSVMVSDPMSIADTYEWGEGEEHIDDVYKVKFTLDQPAYVKVSVNSTICYNGLDNLGNLNNAIVTTVGGKMLGESIGSNIGTIFTNEEHSGYYILEKGSYYIVYNGKESDGYSNKSKGSVTTIIEAEDVMRTGNVTGVSSKSMLPLTNNKAGYGYISNLYSEQYFKFTVTKQSKVSLDMSIADTPSCLKLLMKYELFSIGGISYTEKLKMQKNSAKYSTTERRQLGEGGSFDNFPKSGSTGYVTLPKGTYYLKISGISGQGAVKVTPHITEIKSTPTLKAPKLKKYKKNTKKITGTATKKATVKVKVGKKTYTVKANAKGKFTVKLKAKLKRKTKIVVYAKLKGYKDSKKVTYKVK